MMNSAKVELCRLERSIEIYENERLWIGRGFSKQGLFPTERGPYSTKDGSLSWKTVPEACLALLRGEFVLVGNVGRGQQSIEVGRSFNGSFSDKTSSTKRIVRRGWSFHEQQDGDDNQTNENNDVNETEQDKLNREDKYECSTDDTAGGAGADRADEYCGFTLCNAPGDFADEDGWQYFPDFSEQSLCEQSLLSPNRKRYVLLFNKFQSCFDVHNMICT